jgi:cytochrome P450
MMGTVSPSVATLTDDPHPSLAMIRAAGPIGRVESIGGWMVVGHALAVQVMRDAATFTVDDPRFTTSRVVGPSMLSTDGPEHSRHRQPFLAPFTPRSSRAYFSDFVARESARLVAATAATGSAEFRTALAAPLATACMQSALGLERIPVAELLGWYGDIVQAVADISAGATLPAAGPAAHARLGAAISATIESGQGFLGEIAAAAGELTRDEILSNTAVLLLGGIETTEAMVSNLLLHLLSHPALMADVRADHSLLDAVIDESLRLEPAAAVVDRYATVDVSIGDHRVRRGDLVVVSLAGANRSVSMWPGCWPIALPWTYSVSRG